MSIRSFSCRITSCASSSKIQNSTLQNIPRGTFLSGGDLTCRLVLAITDLAAVLCILHLPLNVILQSRLSGGKCFPRVRFFFFVFVVWGSFISLMLCIFLFLDCSWSFYIFRLLAWHIFA